MTKRLFPVFENIVQRLIKGGFQALFHDGKYLGFQLAFFLLLVFPFLIPVYRHFVLTSPLMMISVGSWPCRSWYS